MPFSLSACDYTVAGISASELSNFMKPRFGDHRLIQTSLNRDASGIKYKKFGLLDISEHTYGSAVEVRVPAMTDIYHFQFILSGFCHWSIDGRIVRLEQGDSVIVPPGHEHSMHYSADCRKLIVKLPGSFLLQTAREFGFLTPSSQIEFKRSPLPFHCSSGLHNLLNDILAFKGGQQADRVSLYYSKLLANAILSTYDSDLCLSLSQTTFKDRHLEQIHNYILDNLASDISIEALAHQCRISRKSLYNLFERELEMTPSAYIRQLRLEAIHGELSQNRNVRNITEVALKYGFTNLGRFAAQYRDHIGELPSDTLRRLERCA